LRKNAACVEPAIAASRPNDAGRIARHASERTMRLPASLMIVCLLATAPAFGATRKDHANCNAADPDRNIAGCTRIINDMSEPAITRGIASVGRGLAWQAKGNSDRAMADFTDAIRLNPRDALAYSDRGILWREKKDVDRAIADFSEAIRISPLSRSDLPGDGHVNMYSNRGLAFFAKGDLDRAWADFDQAVRIDHSHAEAYFYRGKIELMRKDFVHAVADFSDAIRFDPDRTEAWLLRGAARYDQYMFASEWIKADDLDGAIADFSAAIRRDPKEARIYQARSRAWFVHGDKDRAIADLTAAVELNPMNYDMVAELQRLKPDFRLPSIAKGGILKLLDKSAEK
jgi:tetratricopeptide (TPR) repeat protein